MKQASTMDTNIEEIRRTIKLLDKSLSFHLAESSDIASASVCGWKFRLPRIMGVLPRNYTSYIPGTLVHKVLEQSLPELGNFWINVDPNATIESIKDDLLDEWALTKNKIFNEFQRRSPDPDVWIPTAQNRLERIVEVLAHRLKESPPPNRILTEVLITNPKQHQEGKIDAILEYDNGVTTLEWKTYKDSTVSKYDAIQTVANGMLVNYRYGRNDVDFDSNRLLILLPDAAHRVYPTENRLAEISKAKEYILKCLRDEPVRTESPFPAVCQSCGYLDACKFYRSMPVDKKDLERRRRAWRMRYHVLEERASTHKYEFYAAYLSQRQLEKLGIATFGYNAIQYDERLSELIVEGPEPEGVFEGKPVRVIGVEGKNIPLLACVSCSGGIQKISGNEMKVNIFWGNVKQMLDLPFAFLRSEVDLTRADLQAIDLIERRRPDLHPIADVLAGITSEEVVSGSFSAS